MKTYLVCYDIEDDRERRRIAAFLESIGERVQYSVFEVTVRESPDQLTIFAERLRSLASDPESVRFYRLTRDAIADSWTLSGLPLAKQPVAIVVC